MECKADTATGTAGKTDRINRNIVECKVVQYVVEPCDMGVLIETLWNVKYCDSIFHIVKIGY